MTLPNRNRLYLSYDVGLIHFINKVYESSNKTFDNFLKIYSKNVVPNEFLSSNSALIYLSNNGVVKSANSVVDWKNPIMPNTIITNFSDPTLVNINKIINLSAKHAWISNNKLWILYYNPSNTSEPIKLLYNPIYRPGFLDFAAKNIIENVILFYNIYCDIINNTEIVVQNRDANCSQTHVNSLPIELLNFTNKIIELPAATVPSGVLLIDAIKITKLGSRQSLDITNVIIKDFNENNILANLDVNKKSCNISNENNPYLYIYIGDFNVKSITIEGNPVSNNLAGCKVEILNNGVVVKNINLIEDLSTTTSYPKSTYVWTDINTNNIINDYLISNVMLKGFSNFGNLTLADIAIYNGSTSLGNIIGGNIATTNFALNKPVYSSGTLSTNPASNLVDGNINTFATTTFGTVKWFLINFSIGLSLYKDDSILAKDFVIQIRNVTGLDSYKTQNLRIEIYGTRSSEKNIISPFLPGDYALYKWTAFNNNLSLYNADGDMAVSYLAKYIEISRQKLNEDYNISSLATYSTNLMTVGNTIIQENIIYDTSDEWVRRYIIRDNIGNKGDYISSVNVKANSGGKLAGYKITVYNADNQIIAESDILMGDIGKLNCLWTIKDNKYDYFTGASINYSSDDQIVNAVLSPSPKFVGNNLYGSIMNRTNRGWSGGVAENTYSCPNDSYLSSFRPSSRFFAGDVDRFGLQSIYMRCKDLRTNRLTRDLTGTGWFENADFSYDTNNSLIFNQDDGFQTVKVANGNVIEYAFVGQPASNLANIQYEADKDIVRNRIFAGATTNYDCGISGLISGIRTGLMDQNNAGSVVSLGFNCSNLEV